MKKSIYILIAGILLISCQSKIEKRISIAIEIDSILALYQEKQLDSCRHFLKVKKEIGATQKEKDSVREILKRAYSTSDLREYVLNSYTLGYYDSVKKSKTMK